MKVIGIIGGGASGVLTALHCWKKFNTKKKIVIFEPNLKLGIGKAYDTEHTNYLLNVPANEMHIYSDGSDNFEEWVLKQDPNLILSEYWPFVPRFYYAQYLQTHLKKIPSNSLEHIQSVVTEVSISNSKYCLKLNNNTKYEIDYLIVATGFSKIEKILPYHSTADKSQVYRTEEIKSVPPSSLSGRILIIGTGLTAIDIWRQLKANPSLKFSMLSRHGFLPLSKKTNLSSKIKIPYFCGMTPLQIFQILRALHKTTALEWADLANQLSKQVQKIWSCWTSKEKTTFLKFLSPYWEIIRHQMPESVARELQIERENKNIEILAGQIKSIRESNNHITVEYSERHTKQFKTIQCQHLIFAIGSKIENTLIPKYSITGVSHCPYDFGYVNSNSPRLWFAGPSSKGAYFEITSIPFIRTQAQMIANEISQIPEKIQSLRFERFCVHPTAAGETYFEHFQQAMSFAKQLFKLNWYVFVHALFPFLYTDTTSGYLRDLSAVLYKRRQRSTHGTITAPIEPTAPIRRNHAISLDHQNHQQTSH